MNQKRTTEPQGTTAGEQPATEALVCEGVEVRYDGQPVLSGADLRVAMGEIHVVVGPSGSGKTTLLRAVAGFLPISAGRIRVAGQLVDTGQRRDFVPPERRGVGVVFQNYALFPHLSVEKNVAFGVQRDKRTRVPEQLAKVDMARFTKRMPASLSGGEQQRVALARALVVKPNLVLLDEPFSNLNKDLRRRLRAKTIASIRATGAAAVLITHDCEEALSMGDRLTVVCAGQVLQSGLGRDLYEHPTSRAVALCLGDADFLPVTHENGLASTPFGVIETEGEGNWAVVRPENVVVLADEESASHVVAERARVVRRSFLGHTLELELAVAEHIVRARVPKHACPEGEWVRVGFRASITTVND